MDCLKDTVTDIRGHHDAERRKLGNLRDELRVLLEDKEVSRMIGPWLSGFE